MTAIAIPQRQILIPRWLRRTSKEERVMRQIAAGGIRGGINAGAVGVAQAVETPLLLDTVTGAAAAYSLRKLRNAFGGYAAKVRRSSDNAEQDIGFSGNDFDTGAFSAFVGVGSGYVKTWYDQSGNSRDVSQSTTSSQPQIVLNILNGAPILRYSGGQELSGTLGTFNAPATIYCVNYFSQLNQASGNYDYLYSLGTSAVAGGIASAARWAGGSGDADKLYVFDGANVYLDSVLTGQVWTVLTSIHRTSAPKNNAYKNGTSQTISDYPTTLATNGNLGIGWLRTFTTNYFEGDIPELIIYNAEHDTTTRQSVEQNINTYYAIY